MSATLKPINSSSRSVGSSASQETDGSHPHDKQSLQLASKNNNAKNNSNGTSTNGELEPPVLVYHESARSIVFRDHLRRAAESHSNDINNANKNNAASSPTSSGPDLQQELADIGTLFFPDQMPEVTPLIAGFQPNVVPLPHLELGPNDEFLPLLESDNPDAWNTAESEAVAMLQQQRAVVKTIKNNDWTPFLHRFTTPEEPRGRTPDGHHDIGPNNGFHFNSFVTSTSLLPSEGKKMRCYGKANVYTTGVVFALPRFPDADAEQAMAESTRTWSWPAGYSAKTEFNIDSQGNLINGRQEALVSLSQLRQYNDDYQNKEDYMIGGRLLKGGLNTVPYNEVFVRVGGRGRIVNNKDCASGEDQVDEKGTGRSLETGVGLPIALFVRTACFGHLISLLRTRARLMHIWGERHIQGIPILLISSELGVRVLTDTLQKELLKIAAKNLNPFQNPMIAHKTTVDDTDATHLETKLEELIDLDESIRNTLTPEECVKLAGGFGCTDESIAQILKDAMIQDKESEEKGGHENSHMLQDIVNEGLAAAVRSGDYYTSRQLLILYSLVASEKHQMEIDEKVNGITDSDGQNDKLNIREKKLDSEAMLLKRQSAHSSVTISDENSRLPPPPPPPPLDTDRLRSATNSDGLLAVLGAAQVLKAMQDGGAKKRTEESFLAVEEWCDHGEQSMAFRLASWRDQRAAQGDLKIAYEQDSSFMAFVSNKAISNRKNFAKQLREATSTTDFTDVRFLTAIYEMVCRMHSPCLRLELLQYVLGLDNRYSIAHVKRSIELAATCLSISHSRSSS